MYGSKFGCGKRSFKKRSVCLRGCLGPPDLFALKLKPATLGGLRLAYALKKITPAWLRSTATPKSTVVQRYVHTICMTCDMDLNWVLMFSKCCLRFGKCWHSFSCFLLAGSSFLLTGMHVHQAALIPHISSEHFHWSILVERSIYVLKVCRRQSVHSNFSASNLVSSAW